jgi:cysteine synthase
MKLETSIDLIGNSPLLSLGRVYRGEGKIFAKAEFLNPGGSIKDRVALSIIRAARRRGVLVNRQPVVEMTSGNMGAGLAIVCAAFQHPFTAVMSAGNSSARASMMRGLGAEVVLVEQIDGTPGRVTGKDIAAAIAAAVHLAASREAFYVDQFNNPDSVVAHETTTGPELWEQLDGRIDAFVACVGSAGSFVGISRFLKSKDPEIRCVCVEPKDAEILAGHAVLKAGHLLQGTGYGFVPPHWEPDLMDGAISVSDEDAERWRSLLGSQEGLYVGYSAAANVCAAVELMNSGILGPEAQVATLLCDTGLKY